MPSPPSPSSSARPPWRRLGLLALVVAAAAAGYFTSSYEWHMFASIAAATVAAVAIGRGLVIRAASVPLMVAGPLAAEAFERAAMKLPIKTKVVARLGDTSHLEG